MSNSKQFLKTVGILNALSDNEELFTKWAQNKISSEDVVRELIEPKPHTYRAQFEVEFITTKEVSELPIDQIVLKGIAWSFDIKGIAEPKDIKVKLIDE